MIRLSSVLTKSLGLNGPFTCPKRRRGCEVGSGRLSVIRGDGMGESERRIGMKLLMTTVFFLELALVSVALAAGPANSARLVAPAYPHAKLVESGSYSELFLTNDTAGSICEFFKQHGVKLDESNEGGCSAELLNSVAVCHAQDRAHSQAPTDLSNAPEGVTTAPPDTAGVEVTASKTPPPVKSEIYIPVDKYSVFSYLKDEVTKQTALGKTQHTKSQLLALYNKYRWVDSAFYPPHKTAKGAEPYNRWLIEKTSARLGRPMQAANAQVANIAGNEAVLAAQIRQLMTQGKTQEAMQLAKKMEPGMEAGQAVNQRMTKEYKKDRWNTWIDVLKKLKAHAYRTKIDISKKPADWPMRLFPPHSSCLG